MEDFRNIKNQAPNAHEITNVIIQKVSDTIRLGGQRRR
jgi:hypothetical protein